MERMTISIQQKNKIDYRSRSMFRVKLEWKKLFTVFVQLHVQGTKQVRIQTYSVWNCKLELNAESIWQKIKGQVSHCRPKQKNFLILL